MNGIRIPIVAVLALAVSGISALSAQQMAGEELVDRVVAVVGDSVVLHSDVEEQFVQLRSSGQVAPTTPEEEATIRREILNGMITDLLLLQAAIRDSITVSDAEITAAVDNEIAQIQRTVGGGPANLEQILRDELGLTLAEFREMLAQEYRRTSMSQQYLQQVTQTRRPPPVSDAEVRAFFDLYSDQLGTRPATVSFRQLVITPQPTDSARAQARALAEEVLGMARSGEDFAVLARRFSDDPGSREQGGDLGWYRQGAGLVRAFENVLFAMRAGTISDIVETSFGYHIIKLERVRGAERQARHILIRPEITAEDISRTESLAEEAAARVRAGESIDSLIAIYHHPDQQSEASNILVDRLPPEYGAVLSNVTPGQIIGPVRLGTGDQTMYAVISVTGYTPAGEYSLNDLYQEIRSRIEQQKLLDELIEELRSRTYIDIRL